MLIIIVSIYIIVTISAYCGIIAFAVRTLEIKNKDRRDWDDDEEQDNKTDVGGNN
jgi:hypothetical protein